jgi:TPR repeat protein
MQYENGKGVQTDKEKARQLYSKACSLGYPNGCTTLKQMQ